MLQTSLADSTARIRNGAAPRRLRIAHVAPGLQLGGLEKLLVEFARHADRSAFELFFVSLSERGPLAEAIEACGWPVASLNARPGLRPRLVLRLAGLFRQWNIDVVHTHNNGPLIYAATAARLARIPGVVHTRHGQSSRASRRQTALVRLVARLAERIVCVSDDSLRLSVEQGIPARKLCRVWNGIDLEQFAYTGPQPRGPAVLVARLSPEKDIATLLRAVALVVPGEPAFQLEIAGDGACLAELQRLASELGIAENVRLLGLVHDVPALLARASLFVLPSLTEGISLTLLEAMARGLPVVATRVGGNAEVVLDGETGFLIPTGSPAVLAEKILLLWRDPERARRLGQAGRERVERFFNVRAMVGAYEDLYRQVLGGRHAASPVPEALGRIS
jgi:glycosyltransferase involved in cell wall biosynthesis